MGNTLLTLIVSNVTLPPKVVNVLWSARNFGGAEIYVATMHRLWGTETIALQNLDFKEKLRLVSRIFCGRELFIFHDLRAALLGFLRPTSRNVSVIHGPGRYARVTRAIVSLQAYTQRFVVLVSNDIHPAPPTSRVVVLENFSSAGIESTDCSEDAIYFGRITETKGVDRMLSFWHRHKPGGNLHVIGDGDLLDEMKSLYDIEGSEILFYGALPRERIADIASTCRYYLSFSNREGLSLSLLEAMDGGLIPLVAELPSQEFVFEIPGIPAVTEDGYTLATNIQRINSLSPGERAELRETIRSHVRTCFRNRWFGFWNAFMKGETLPVKTKQF